MGKTRMEKLERKKKVEIKKANQIIKPYLGLVQQAQVEAGSETSLLVS